MPEGLAKTGGAHFQPDPPDRTQVELLARLSAAQRVRAMLDARELAVGLIRGSLRRRYPELPASALNLKILEEVYRAEPRTTRP